MSRKITKIIPQRNKRRLNIYLDGKFGFGFDLENYIKSKIYVGTELSEGEISELKKGDDYKKYSDNLLRFATLRPRSKQEINFWFVRKKVNPLHQNELLKKLEKLDLVNDENFAKWWVDQRLQFKSKSKRELVQELRNKGIEGKVIEQVLSESDLDEFKSVKRLVEKNSYRWSLLPKKEARQKMQIFLARKGFGWDVIKKTVKELED